MNPYELEQALMTYAMKHRMNGERAKAFGLVMETLREDITQGVDQWVRDGRGDWMNNIETKGGR